MLYYAIIVLKVFCFYHIYKNHKPYYWFFLIIFIPVLGAIIYIITQVLTRGDVDTLQSEITSIVNPTKQIKDLEKQLEFTDTYANRINLADAYFSIGAYQNATVNYEKALADKVQNPTYPHQQLVLCYFQLKAYDQVLHYADKIKNIPDFKGSKQQFYYGLTLREKGQIEDAEAQLKEINRPYSNYKERLELAKFYLDNGKENIGKEILEDINSEAQHMTKPNRKLFKATVNEAEQMLKTL